MPRRAALVLALLAGLLSAGAVPAAHADTTTARALLFKLTLAAEGGSTTYDRTGLIAESQVSVIAGDGPGPMPQGEHRSCRRVAGGVGVRRSELGFDRRQAVLQRIRYGRSLLAFTTT